MPFEFLTLDDVDVEGKTIFLRVDVNSPIDPSTERILDDSRIKAITPTLQELRAARIVLGSHQSRPGRYDFTSLQAHARVIQMYYDGPVKFIDDVIGPKALEAIESLKTGEILVLDNLRKIDEENRNMPPAAAAKTRLVEALAPHFDLVVNDAFAAAHRSQPSLIGFGEFLPMVAGRLMQRELEALERVLENPDRPCIFILGGAKVEDRLPVIERVLREGIADKVLLGGLVQEPFLMARGYLPKRLEQLDDSGRRLVDEASRLLDAYGDRIELPVDLALDVGGERIEVGVGKLTDETNIYDIGLNTIVRYIDEVKAAGTIVAEGPLGMFERRGFHIGTKELLKTMAESQAYTLIGGGHLGAMASLLGLEGKIDHISTGGGALLTLLAGAPMPVIQALERAKEKWGSQQG
ncbi:MAG TPA: phosphoglycerate kinase [Candidatus Bathyarchaeota archaeon]|nr:phosphoglycerate kinase [Candidatus Bathyarchaeota archaeon]